MVGSLRGSGYTRNMFELEVRRTFSAAHAIIIRGEREPLHGHDWQVELTVRAADLDGDFLACDFHALESSLEEVLAPFISRNLNETPPFDEVNPTAEAVAHFIAEEMTIRIPTRVELCSVRVTEAPGCAARFIPSVKPSLVALPPNSQPSVHVGNSSRLERTKS